MKVVIEISYNKVLLIEPRDLDTFLKITGGLQYSTEGYGSDMKVYTDKKITDIRLIDESCIDPEREEEKSNED